MDEIPSVKPSEIADLARATKEVLPDTVNEVDKALSTLVGWFDSYVLYPLKKASINYRYKIQCFESDVKKKTESVPPEKICEPKLSIAGPILEALKYSYDEESLREMYVNLLAASINCDRAPIAHPAFVEIIKQLSPADAKFLNIFLRKSTYPGITVIECHEDNKLTPYLQTIIELFDSTALFSAIELLKFSPIIDNLIRLGLVIKNNSVLELDYDYEKLKNSFIYQGYQLLKEPNSKLKINKFRLEMTDFGNLFKQCCME